MMKKRTISADRQAQVCAGQLLLDQHLAAQWKPERDVWWRRLSIHTVAAYWALEYDRLR